jgi:hypothetical protein
MAWSSDLKTSLKTLNQEAEGNGGMCPKTMTGINILHGFYHEVSAPELIISTLNTTDS